MSLTSPTPVSGRHPGSSLTDVARLLTPARRSLGLRRIGRSALAGGVAGAALGVTLVIAAHFYSFRPSVAAALGAVVVGLLLGAGIGATRWPRAQEVARSADRHFELHDRLTTALELQGDETAIAALQRDDAASRAGTLPLKAVGPPWLRLREAGVVAVAALALASALAFVPAHAPASRAAGQSASEQRVRRAAAASVHRLSSRLGQGLTPQQLQSPAMRRLDLALARLHRELLHATNQRAALRAISSTQAQLRSLAASLHPINRKAASQLAGSLGRYLRRTGSSGTGKSAKRSALQSAQAQARALNQLAKALSHLTPAQRAALARALEKAANGQSNQNLRSQLQQSASALGNGDQQSAGKLMQQMAQTLSNSAGSQAALSRILGAGSQLNGLKNQISGLTGTNLPSGLGSRSAGLNGAGTRGANGRGARPGVGLGQGRGRGQQGYGSGRGRGQGRLGTGKGQRQGIGSGKGRNAGRSGSRQGSARSRGSGTGRPNPTRAGKYVTVFVPGAQGKGPETVQNGPNGLPETGALVPYQRVIGKYAPSAHQALDRPGVPPALQAYLRRYFSAISQ